MPGQWFYLNEGKPVGPVGEDSLLLLFRDGALDASSHVWKEGMAAWQPAAQIPDLVVHVPVGMPPPPPPSGVVVAARPANLLGGIAAGISRYTELPTLSDVPVRDVLIGSLQAAARRMSVEDELIVGTAQTTPSLAAVPSGWPVPRIFWRIFAVALATYLLLQTGLSRFGNPNFIPGMIVIGSFVVPLSIVVLFFEMNTPRNVSLYQVGKMFLLGGSLSLVVTMFVFTMVPGSGVGALLPALLTGVGEETGKALTLLILVGVARYRWQLNGLLFGAAVGAGFAGFESAGYAFRAALETNTVDAAVSSILIRGLLAPGGHVIWTAMVGSAIWKVKGDRPFAPGMLFHRTVVRRWTVAVVLHGLWDTDLLLIPWWLQCAILLVVGWYIIFAIFKEAFAEVDTAKQQALAGAAAVGA